MRIRDGLVSPKGRVRSLFPHIDECIDLEFENAFATDYNEKGGLSRILTKHLEVLTVDRRAMYIMAMKLRQSLTGSGER